MKTSAILNMIKKALMKVNLDEQCDSNILTLFGNGST